MGPVSLHCTEILLCLKISIRLGSDSVWCASLILHRKYKVHEVGFVTAETGLLHLHCDSKEECERMRTHTQTREAPPPNAKTISSDNGGTLDTTSVFSEQC